jgi:hypothetical protein
MLNVNSIDLFAFQIYSLFLDLKEIAFRIIAGTLVKLYRHEENFEDQMGDERRKAESLYTKLHSALGTDEARILRWMTVRKGRVSSVSY